jgi:hypothetical protein
MVLPSLLEYTLALCLTLVPGKDHRELASSISAATEEGIREALFKADHDEEVEGVVLPARSKSAALMVAISFRESGLQPRKMGDCPGLAPGDQTCSVQKGGTSFGAFQLALPFHHKGSVTGLTGVQLLEEAKAEVRASLREAAEEGAIDFETLRRHARRSLGKFISERTRRRPAIIPVVIEV